MTSHIHTSLSLFFSTSLQMTSHIHRPLPLLSIPERSINFSPTFKESQESFSKVKNSGPLNHNLFDSSSTGLTPRETVSTGFLFVSINLKQAVSTKFLISLTLFGINTGKTLLVFTIQEYATEESVHK